jgi:hypothetical protein
MRVLLLLGFAAAAHFQQIVTLNTREGVTQSFFVPDPATVAPEATALLFVGGVGGINLRLEQGQVRFGAGNFLPRSRGEFLRNGVLPVILDNPSDRQGGAGMSDDCCIGREHERDVRVVLGELTQRFPGLPLFLVGTSRGTISVAYLGRALAGEIAGIVLSSSLWRIRHPGALAAFDWSSLRVPVLLVHHRDDACWATLYSDIPAAAAKYPLVSVRGGKPTQSGPCEPFAAHGFWGKEPETVDAIAGWMLGKPFRTEIQ